MFLLQGQNNFPTMINTVIFIMIAFIFAKNALMIPSSFGKEFYLLGWLVKRYLWKRIWKIAFFKMLLKQHLKKKTYSCLIVDSGRLACSVPALTRFKKQILFHIEPFWFG